MAGAQPSRHERRGFRKVITGDATRLAGHICGARRRRERGGYAEEEVGLKANAIR